MSRFSPRAQGEQSRDAGFTLIEVIWALVLLGIIAMASLGLFTNGLKSVAHVQRQQAAVSVANTGMDTARSVAGGAVNAEKTSGLVRGRSKEAVDAAWDAADPVDVADMDKVWDHQNGLNESDQWVPITSTARVDSQTYTITTLVGACYRLRAASTSSEDCIPGKDEDPSYNKMYRVRVIVTWDEGTKDYSYRLSTLVDPSDDPTWNTELDPYAYDDDVSVDAGASDQFIAIVSNDTVEYDVDGSTNPIYHLSGTSPSFGTVAKGGAGHLNGVYFSAPADRSGTVTFTYDLRELNGKQSDTGTVTVHIRPVPVTDTIYVPTGSTTTLNAKLLANDMGVTNIDPERKTTIVPVWDPGVDMFTTEDVTQETQDAREKDATQLAAAGITTSGGNVVFHAPDEKTDTEFYYYLVDDPVSGDAIRYPSGTAVKVKVSTEDPPMYTPDKSLPSYEVREDATYVDDVIEWKSLTGNQYADAIRITGVTGSVADGTFEDNILLDDQPYTAPNQQGEELTFARNVNSMGTYVISYKVVSSSGVVSDTTGTITVKVAPHAADRNFGDVSYGGTFYNRYVDLDLKGAGIVPTSGVTVVNIKRVGNSTCTVPNSSNSTTIHITGVSNSKQCQFTYQLASVSDPDLMSGTGTITFKAVSP